MQKIHKNILHTLTKLCTLLLLLWMPKASAQTTATFSQTYNSNSTITIPASATNITVKAWGGGGSGGSRSSNGVGGGGGGGAYSESNWATLTSGTYTIVVGAGGAANGDPGNGGDSRFYLNSNTDLVRAKGGLGVTNNTTTGAAGGQANDGVGTITVNGSNGANANSSGNTSGGAGGNAGGTTANPGGAGGPSQNSNNSNGNSGQAPGGGGGGAKRTSGGFLNTTRNGGAGGTGRVIVTYTYTVSVLPLIGSGSRDLYPSGATGHRSNLTGITEGVAEALPFINKGAHYVFAQAGEIITLGSSAQGVGAGRIQMFNPAGVSVVNDATNGKIPNRAAELAGPKMFGIPATDDRFIPIYYEVSTTGIYRVEFTAPVSSNTSNNPVAANANWIQGNTYSIHAWDVAVINSERTSFIPGRTYVTNLNLSNGNNTGIAYNNFKFDGRVFVRTRDGYTYKVKHNGSSGIAYSFFVNNLGFKTTPTSNIASYKSLNQEPGTAALRIHNPNIPDNANNITHKMFYTMPSDDLPATANASIGVSGYSNSTPVNNSSTWLKTEPVEPNVTNLQLLGVEGTEGFFGHKGGHILFDAPIDGQEYEIQVILPAYGNQVFHTINGTTVNGQNSIYWNGTGSATINGAPITSLAGLGNTDVDIKVQLRGAEVHFPFFDIEYNQGGISVELLDYKNINYTNPDNTAVVSNIVYWDDSDIPLGTNPSGTEARRRRSDPQNNSHTVGNGQNSTTNGHIYGVGASNTGTNTFGDRKSLDTWTFIEGTSQTIHSLIDVKEADLYTDVSYTINGTANATSATVGDAIVYTVTAGNNGPSDVIADASRNLKGAAFTFQVPGGVAITGTPTYTISCTNGTAQMKGPLNYDASTRMYSAEFSLSDGCFITYTFNGVLTGAGGQVAEATIMRPADVTDPDATNPTTEGGAPTNPHFECYNHDTGGTGTGSNEQIACNNITEAIFMILEDCVDEVLYYEDFDRGYFAVNSGRTDWVNIPSISVVNGVIQTDPITGAIIRNGQPGGATSSYLFAPGQNDARYPAANATHSADASVARIKAGYYSVNPPGYVQMGIPSTDQWSVGTWDPNAASNDPNDPNSNYDWTRAWDVPGNIRDMSGAVNGSAFLVRGAAGAAESVRSFYEFNIPTALQEGDTYTMNLYSYVTYHNRDYMLMDVVDQVTGQIYASVPLVNPEIQSSGNIPEGFQLGWIYLTASFTLDSAVCTSAVGRTVKIAIRGSKDRSLTSGGGFGHTLLDNILLTKRISDATCIIPASPLECSLSDVCYEDIAQQGISWNSGTTVTSQTIIQDSDNDGFVLDIYQLNSTLDIKVNGGPLYEDANGIPVALEFGSTGQNVRFTSDNASWGNGIPTIGQINAGATINITNRRENSVSPAVKIMIDAQGNVTLWGKRSNGAALEELEVFGVTGGRLNNYPWSDGVGSHNISVQQTTAGSTTLTAVGYARKLKEDCESCVLEKDGVFQDENSDGRAAVGETITYTFDVKNAGDMDIKNVVITDPLFGFNIVVNPDTYQVVQPVGTTISFTGDQNTNGVLERHETWTFTVSYTVTQSDINNRGVYNRATTTGSGYVIPDRERTFSVESTDPTPYEEGDEGWDPDRPNHTFVPLKGGGVLITNPMIYQRMK